MLCVPPLLLPYHHRQLGVPLLSASSSLCAADAWKDAMTDEEGGVANNVFASLMPNLFNRLNHCDDTVSEQEFQEIHRLLNARSEDDVIERNTSISQPSDRNTQEEVKNIQDDEKAQEGLEKNPSSFIKSDYGGGKENASPKNPPQRNKLSRRERSSRVTTHRKPFVVDIRSFGSILNNNALGKCEKPQDVHAFWEAADEREASRAIMDKLRGRCEQKTVSGTTSLRRVGVRRKNSQRMTTRLKRFAVELPSCAEQVQSLDQELLEEEEDATEESSFTFLSNPEFRIRNQPLEQKDEMQKIKGSQLSSPLNIIKTSMNMSYLDEVRDQPEDLDILSDGKSPALYVTETDNGQSSAGVRDATGEVPECNKQSQASELVDVPQTGIVEDFVTNTASIIHDTVLVENHDAAGIFEIKATPYNRNLASKRTPFTSPTPPSNPLAVFGLTKETVAEDMSKRRLDFDDTMDLPAFGMELPAPIMQNTPSLQIFSSPCNKLAEEELLGSAEVLNAKPVPPTASVSSEALNSFHQIAAKPPKPTTTKRKNPVDNRRNSLAGAGTSWEEGHRRSTRIKSRPLEWWRGERFLRGRVHKSLATVIGIKYSSPPPCWPKRGSRTPKFKVESYVPDEYAKYVQFAALG